MSIARWCDGDLYIYNSASGFVCMDCPLLKRHRALGDVVPHDFVCQTLLGLNDHVIEHKQAGDDVAESTLGIIAGYIQEQSGSTDDGRNRDYRGRASGCH